MGIMSQSSKPTPIAIPNDLAKQIADVALRMDAGFQRVTV